MRVPVVRVLAALVLVVLGVGGPLVAVRPAGAGGLPSAPDDASGYGAAIAQGTPGRPAALVALVPPGGGVPWCSGSVVAAGAVLTAAHCVHGLAAGAVEVLAGARRVAVASVTVHPGYDPREAVLDLAVLRTVVPVVGVGVQRVPLPAQGDQTVAAPGSTVTAAGYGCAVEVPGPAGSVTCVGRGVARTAELPVRTPVECEQALRELGADGHRPDLELCAGWWSADGTAADTCRGDSGGPLLATAPGGGAVLAGVVSFGASRCGGAPGFATRVAAAADWVRQQAGPLTTSGYWLLTDDGTVLGFGDAPSAGPAGAPGGAATFSAPGAGEDAGTPAGERAVDLAPGPVGMVVLREGGRVDGVPGGSVQLPAGRWAAVAAGVGDQVVAVTADGRVATVHGPVPLSWRPTVPLNAPVVDVALTPTGRGVWVLAADGGVFTVGDATFAGSMGGRPVNAPVVGLAATASGRGYWLVAADGGVFAFGDATFAGSMGGRVLNAPVIGMARYGRGYALVARDGGVFVFSDLPFLGSLGAAPPARPVVALAPLPG